MDKIAFKPHSFEIYNFAIKLYGNLTIVYYIWNPSRFEFFVFFYNKYNNNNNMYLLQLGFYPVAVVTLHVYKT